MAGPLKGIRVLDFGMAAVGPLATTYLGLLGQILNAAATIGEALREGIKRIDLHSQGVSWELNTEGNFSTVTRQIDGFLELGTVQVIHLLYDNAVAVEEKRWARVTMGTGLNVQNLPPQPG